MLRTTPYLPMARIFVMVPVVAIVIQLVWVFAVFIRADIRAEIVDKMSSIACVSSVLNIRASRSFFLLPRLDSENSSRAKGEAVGAFKEHFV